LKSLLRFTRISQTLAAHLATHLAQICLPRGRLELIEPEQ
jgi:hypothetical protein